MKRWLSIAFGLALVCISALTQTAAQSGAVRKKPDAKSAEQEQKQDDGAPQADEHKAYNGKQVTKRAVILSKPAPDYPRRARRSNVEGKVVLRIILSADGSVGEEIEVLSGLPEGVTEAATAAARKIQFTPAEKDGRPVSQYVTVIYNFNLY
jgi:TonB family protein